MIYLHTLGDAVIKVGEREIRPSSPMVFGTLLYLCVERGHRVSRTALRELLFPKASERSGAHSLRQLLYKLRQLGVPLEADAAGVTIPARVVQDTSDSAAGNGAGIVGLALGMLPGYEPHISPDFERWLEQYRSEQLTRTRAMVLSELSQARKSGNYRRVEETATALLKLDPLNEEATYARAEALALNGQKRDAVRMLEEYSAEVGLTSPELRISADLLRRRITERLVVSERPSIPLLGRDDELSLLLSHFQRAVGGESTVSVIWGDAGIGKTRLVQELSAHIALRGARLETAHCQPHDTSRPLGALIDLVPKLLQARGALGVSPESLTALRRLAGDAEADPVSALPISSELVSARIREAIRDLLLCVSAEATLVLVVEDGHWLDAASLRLLLTTIPAHSARLHLVLTQRDRLRLADVRPSPNVFVRQLEPLDSLASANLLNDALGGEHVLDQSVRDQCLALGAGNPLFICTIAEHLRQGGSTPTSRSGVTDLLRQRTHILDPRALLLLRFVAATGKLGTHQRLSRCTAMPPEAQLLAIQELASRGLIASEEGVIKCSHDLLSEVVLADTPLALRVPLYERVATVLEEDGTTGKQVNVLWSCAEAWRAADNKVRAATVLQRCADFAIEVGQPRFACQALEQAEQMVGEEEQISILQKSIKAAEMAFDSDAVLGTVERLRSLRHKAGLSARGDYASELAAINATRRKNGSIWQFADTLSSWALDAHAASSDRLRAARYFMYAAEHQFAKHEADRLYSKLREGDLLEDDSEEGEQLSMVFHCLFGEMKEAAAKARWLLSTHPEGTTERAFIMGNCGIVLFRAGETGQALEVLERYVATLARLNMPGLLANDCSRLAACYHYLGDRQNAAEWTSRVDQIVRQYGVVCPAHLANKIEFSVQDRDFATARVYLKALYMLHPDGIPAYNRRLAMASEILILLGQRETDSALFDLDAIEAMYNNGKRASDHDLFTYAFGEALFLTGQRTRATFLLLNYVNNWRRDRFGLPFYFLPLFDSLELFVDERQTGNGRPFMLSQRQS